MLLHNDLGAVKLFAFTGDSGVQWLLLGQPLATKHTHRPTAEASEKIFRTYNDSLVESAVAILVQT